jgi:hypothetical protein
VRLLHILERGKMIKSRFLYHKYIVLTAAAGMNLMMGVNYSWSVFNKALVEELSWPKLDASLPYTVYIMGSYSLPGVWQDF